MANFDNLKATIRANIYANGEELIRGDILQSTLIDMVDDLGEHAGGGRAIGGYVVLDDISELPDPGQPNLGYLIGTHLYIYVGTGGDVMDGKYYDAGEFKGEPGTPGEPGAPGEPGVGFQSVTTQEDGTIVITLTSGDTITIDLNHVHPQYPRYMLLANEAAYEALATKESDTLYLIPEI